MDKKIKTTIKFEVMRKTSITEGTYPVKVQVVIADEITNDEACDIAVHVVKDLKAGPANEVTIKRSDSEEITKELDPDQQTIEFDDDSPGGSIKEM